MTIFVTTGSTAAVAPVPAARTAQPGDAGVAAPLLPEPVAFSADALVALQQLFAQSNREDAASAKIDVERKSQEKKAAQQREAEALEHARKAQEEKGGLFDSMGIGSLVGIVTANPILVIADMSMHMARLTPDFLRDFEKGNKDSIELATKLYCAVGNAGVLADGIITPESLRAAIALGGLLVQETGVFGKEASDWAGAGMIVAGSQDGRAAATVLVADKDSAVADEIRDVERDTQEYTKWAAVAGMVLAASAAAVGSFGTAAFVSTVIVVSIGVALSAGGFAVAETKCLDEALGKGASTWIGSGMMVGGALVSGVGATVVAGGATQAASAATRALTIGGTVLSGGAQVRQGLETVHNASIQYEVDQSHKDAKEQFFQAQRFQRMVEDIIDTVRDLKDSYLRVTKVVSETVDMQCQTQLAAAGMRG